MKPKLDPIPRSRMAWPVAALIVLTVLSPCIAAPPPPLIAFQGRLHDPVSGVVKPDGSYSATFNLYGSATGGLAVWTESKSITVSEGFFTTMLGNTTTIDPSDFNQERLWIGIRIESDPEMVPRHRISWSPYAIEAYQVGGLEPSQFLRSDRSDTMAVDDAANDALTITQATGRAALFAESQADDPGEGTIHAVAGTPAADDPNDGAAVWGSSADHYGVAGHSDSSVGTAGGSVNWWGVKAFSTSSDGLHATSHSGYGAYAESITNHAIYAGGTGRIAASKLVYHTPRKHWHAIPGGAFRPDEIVPGMAFDGTRANVGAYFTAGTISNMMAPVYLPHGAKVTTLKVTFLDDSQSHDLDVVLYRREDTNSSLMAEFRSTGTPGLDSGEDASVSLATIDNENYAYLVSVTVHPFSSDWATAGADILLKRVNIEYELSEAQ